MTEKIEIAIDHLLGLIVSAPLHEAENVCRLMDILAERTGEGTYIVLCFSSLIRCYFDGW